MIQTAFAGFIVAPS